MLFNSLDFAAFLPIVFILFWCINQKEIKLQNLLLLVSSYVFYGWWDWKFLSLIIFSSILDFVLGLAIHKETIPKKRKVFLWISIFCNLGLLGVFKYYNFFIDNFVEVFSFFGTSIKANSLDIIIPVGISFYTFQTLSYTIDIYRNKIKPTNDFIAFAAFVSFFPQLVAGPIERAKDLLPQFSKERIFNYHQATDGLRQILWGLFKKMVIADNCAVYADIIFNTPEDYSGSTLIIGALFFTFQIYADFSGYSDIAIGTARLFGFNLKQNFAFPYFSRDIAEFWRRWHISLSTWFRDYVYIPLGGSRVSSLKKIRNTFIIFLVSGFWHGANWTFIIWGTLNAIYFLPLLLGKRNRNHLDNVAHSSLFPNIRESLQILFTFSITVFAWIFFRAESISDAFIYISGICSKSILEAPYFLGIKNASVTALLIVLLIITEWLGRNKKHALEGLQNKWNRPARWSVYCGIIFIIGMFMNTQETAFIYFQF